MFKFRSDSPDILRQVETALFDDASNKAYVGDLRRRACTSWRSPRPAANSTPRATRWTAFCPTATNLRTAPYNITDANNGLNGVIRASHRQNYLIPPRRHRSFPLSELL